jgi:hypothetical protein
VPKPKTERTSITIHRDAGLRFYVFFEVKKYPKGGRSHCIRICDDSSSRNIDIYLDHMDLEDLGFLSHELNQLFLGRLEDLKKKSGF